MALEIILKGNIEKNSAQEKTNEITIQGITYSIKTSEYNSLQDLLNYTETEIEDVKNKNNIKYYRNSTKYFTINLTQNGNYYEITGIEITHYSLTSLPDSIGNLTQLEKLYLGFNKLGLLPDSIGNLKQLETLNLGINNLELLPDSITKISIIKNALDNSSCFAENCDLEKCVVKYKLNELRNKLINTAEDIDSSKVSKLLDENYELTNEIFTPNIIDMITQKYNNEQIQELFKKYALKIITKKGLKILL